MGSKPESSLELVSFDGFLFDMDGTIIDSTPAVIKHWHTYALALIPLSLNFAKDVTQRRR